MQKRYAAGIALGVLTVPATAGEEPGMSAAESISYGAGWLAYQRSRPDTDNPYYDISLDLHAAWAIGWTAARNLRPCLAAGGPLQLEAGPRQ